MSLTPDDIDAAIVADAERYLAGIRPILERARTIPLTPEERALLAELVAGLRELDVDLRLFGADGEAELLRAMLGEGPPGTA